MRCPFLASFFFDTTGSKIFYKQIYHWINFSPFQALYLQVQLILGSVTWTPHLPHKPLMRNPRFILAFRFMVR